MYFPYIELNVLFLFLFGIARLLVVLPVVVYMQRILSCDFRYAIGCVRARIVNFLFLFVFFAVLLSSCASESYLFTELKYYYY